MNDDIEKADRIVFGDAKIVERVHNTLHANRVDPNTLRRGAYFEWLDAKHACGLGPGAPLADIAAEVVRIDAEERRTKEPDDGLPPGPWTHDYTNGVVVSADGKSIMHGDVFGRYANVMSYFVRCGSPAVRRLLAAFDVTEERVNDRSVAVILMENDKCVAYAAEPWKGSNVICWLTPRSKP